MNGKGPADITVLWLEEFDVVFVLDLDLLDVRFWASADRTLHIQHA